MRNYGFSLVEALVAIFIIVILMVFVVNLFPFIYKGLALSENHVNAAYLGRSLLEEARRTYFDDIVSYSGTEATEIIKNGRKTRLNMDYKLDVSLIDEDKKQVWVTITWGDSSNQKKVVLETIIVNL